MNELEFQFDENSYKMLSPFDSDSSAELFQTNLDETFSAGGSLPICVPPGLVYVGDRQSLIIFERPPRYQKVMFSRFRRDKAKEHMEANEEYRIPLPWQIYVGEFGTNGLLNALHVYFAGNEISGLEISELKPYSLIKLQIKNGGHIFSCPLPNVYETNLVCLDKETSQTENTNLASKVNLMYSSVWDTSFNADILYQVETQATYSSSKGYHIRSYRTGSIGSAWMKFWESRMLSDVVGETADQLFFHQSNIQPGNGIKLSEWFITPSPYKFINTLQQLI